MKTLLNKKEVAEILNCSIAKIDNWVFTRKIPFLKIGRSVRFCPDEIQQFLELCKQSNNGEN